LINEEGEEEEDNTCSTEISAETLPKESEITSIASDIGI
jgi:hypothetical protein